MRGYSAQQLVEQADSEEESPSPTPAPSPGGRENIQASESHVRRHWRVRSPSTPYLTPSAPTAPGAAPAWPAVPRARGRGLRANSQRHASADPRSDKISPVSTSLSFHSVTAKNATAGSGLCLHCLNRRSMRGFSHPPSAIQAPLCCVPGAVGVPLLPHPRADLRACRTPGRALLSPRAAGSSPSTHALLGLAFSLPSTSSSLTAGSSLSSFQRRPPAGGTGTSLSADAEN